MYEIDECHNLSSKIRKVTCWQDEQVARTHDPTTLLYAVVEYLKSTKHLYDPVDHKPEQDGQYRLVCLAPSADDAARLAHLLRAMDDGTY